MEGFNLFIGGMSGIFKGVKVSHKKGIHNIKNLQKLQDITHRNEVTFLNWVDEIENEVLIGYSNQLVKIFDLNTNSFIYNEEMKVGDGSICGVLKINGSLLTAVESGVVKIWNKKTTVIDTGGLLSRMRQNPNKKNIIGTGGKENDLKLWDLESGINTFHAKNVRHDELELRVPVWVMDLAFISNSKQVATATRYGHVRLYDPSTPTRRPVCEVIGKDLSFTCIAIAPREHQVMVGCTTGNMFLVDLRSKGVLLNKYRGFTGSVRQIACPMSEPYVVSVSLDRHLRIHHLNTKKLLFKEYMQSRLSALLLKSSFTLEDFEAKDIMENEEDMKNEIAEEYKELINEIEIVCDQKNTAEKPKLKTKNQNESIVNDESEEDYENLFNEMEVVTEKRAYKGKVKSKQKRFKS